MNSEIHLCAFSLCKVSSPQAIFPVGHRKEMLTSYSIHGLIWQISASMFRGVGSSSAHDFYMNMIQILDVGK